MLTGVAAGAAAGVLEARRLTRFLVDFLAAGLLAVRFLVDFLAGLRLAVFFFGDALAAFFFFFFGDRLAAFFAARFFVAISCGSFRFSAQLVSLVYPPGAEVRGETTSQQKIFAPQHAAVA
jgi:hypothetical protein